MDPLFIGGCGRSGTTLLVDLVGCHSQISPIYEPWFIFDVGRLIFIEKGMPALERVRAIKEGVDGWIRNLEDIPHNKKSTERYRHGAWNIRFRTETLRRETHRLCDRLMVEPALAPFRDYIAALFAEQATIEGKPYWACKVPRFVLMAPLLKQAFPNMRFVHCVRDPRATIPSMASRNWAPKDIAGQIEYWQINVERGHGFASRFPAQVVELRYEDTTAEPATVLSRLFRWLGVEDESAAIVARYQRDFPITPAAARRGDRLADADRVRIERSLAPQMQRYGYR